MSELKQPRLIILDRDGVINEDSHEYIKSPAEFIPIPNSLQAIVRLQQAGFKIAIATNQSGLARAYFDATTLAAIHQKLIDLLHSLGGHAVDIFICPHGPEDGCRCRKPQPGLLEQIANKFGPITGLPFVGDSQRDLQAALAANCKPILVTTGNGLDTLKNLESNLKAQVSVFKDLFAFVDHLLLDV